MTSFLFKILVDHYRTLPAGWSVFTHLLPLVVAVPILYGFRPNEGQLGAVITAVSIYSALLFGILVPAGDQAKRISDNIKERFSGDLDTEQKLKKQDLEAHRDVARSILANVAYSIVISLFDVFLLIVALCLKKPDPEKGKAAVAELPMYPVVLGVSAYLFAFLLILLLVVVRTVYGSWLKESTK